MMKIGKGFTKGVKKENAKPKDTITDRWAG